MKTIEVHGEPFPLDESICKKCKNLMARIIIPMNIGEYGISEKDVLELDIPDDEDVKILVYTCLVSKQEMDYIVLRCNNFSCRPTSILSQDPYDYTKD